MKRKMAYDFLLNICATAIPLVVLQIGIFPQIADREGEAAYGAMVTVLSLITMGAETVGNSLNNTRLLLQNKYIEYSLEGDFNRILFFGVIVDVIVIIGGYIYLFGDSSAVIMVLFASVLILMRTYFIVAFRLHIDYRSIFVNNCILAIGYIVGYYGFIYFGAWTLIYIIANSLCLAHIFFTSNIMQESFGKTAFFNETVMCMRELYASDVVKSFSTYADRLLIYPLLGSSAVAYYYAATIMGKMIAMGVTPISSVILSYVTQKKELNKKMLWNSAIIFAIVVIPLYLCSLMTAKIIIWILYRNMFDAVQSLLLCTMATSIISAVASLMQPLVLCYGGSRIQLFINIVSLMTYLACAFVGFRLWGLMGFCIAIFISETLKFSVYGIVLSRYMPEHT